MSQDSPTRRTPRRAHASTPAAPASPRQPAKARKNMRLDQGLLGAAREALGVADETAAVTVALERVVANRRAADALRAWGGRRALDASRLDD